MVFNGLRIPRACPWYSGIYTLLKIRRIMMVQEKEKGKGKINEALAILEEAAKDKKEELNKLVGSGYANAVSYTHLRAHETRHDLVCRLLLEKKKNHKQC